MDYINLILGAFSAVFAGYIVWDKSNSFLEFKKRARKYSQTIELRRKYSKYFVRLPKNEKVKRIVISDKDIDNFQNLTEAFERVTISITPEELREIRADLKKSILVDAGIKISLTDKILEDLEIKNNDYFKRAISAGLASSVFNSFISATDKESINRSTIVGVLVSKKISNDTKAYAMLMGALTSYLILSSLGIVTFNILNIIFLLMLLGGVDTQSKNA